MVSRERHLAPATAHLHAEFAPGEVAYRWLERLCFTHASVLVTVCRSFAAAMAHEWSSARRTVRLSRNIPDRAREPSRDYPPLKVLAFAPGCTLIIRSLEIESYGP